MNTVNLRKLAQGLRGPLRAEFNMDHFAVINNIRTYCIGHLDEPLNHCGTSGCAMGHGFYLVEPLLPNENTEKYTRRVYGINDEEHSCTIWSWCFSGRWKEVDNTPVGAAERIEYILDHGVLSVWDMTNMQNGAAPLIYKGYQSP